MSLEGAAVAESWKPRPTGGAEVQLQPNTPLPPEPMGGGGAKPASIGFPRQGKDGDSRQVQPYRLLLQCFEVNVAATAVAWRKVVK